MDASSLVKLVGQVARVADAITAPAIPGSDATGGNVASLTEAVMGMTAGLVQIADAIHELADAISSRPQ